MRVVAIVVSLSIAGCATVDPTDQASSVSIATTDPVLVEQSKTAVRKSTKDFGAKFSNVFMTQTVSQDKKIDTVCGFVNYTLQTGKPSGQVLFFANKEKGVRFERNDLTKFSAAEVLQSKLDRGSLALYCPHRLR